VVVFNDVTDLRRLESMRRDFVANVSHELRTPITAIRAAAETLAGGALSDPIAAADFVGIISRHSDRLERLVEDLLDLSRIEARRWQLAIEPLEIGEAITAAIETVGVAARSRGTSVRGNVPAGLVAQADRRAVEQVLVNLLDNAVKYAAPSATIEVRARCSDGKLIVEVEDDGPGIDQRHLPRLFERFYRVDAGRSRSVGGTGLGLSIVKHLVEAMGGTVQVESRIGDGTTFIVSLPTAAPTIALGAAAVPPGLPS
jgi:two-component system phosphate regulon sensor histidine kinase PhoR